MGDSSGLGSGWKFKIIMNGMLDAVVENWTRCINRFQQKDGNLKKKVSHMYNLAVKKKIQ